MSMDESAAVGGLTRKPPYRADCADFYCQPDDECIVFHMPADIRNALEAQAERADRTWNVQLIYVLKVCTGEAMPLLHDVRTVNDWRTLMATTEISFDDGGKWRPFPVLYPAEYNSGELKKVSMIQ